MKCVWPAGPAEQEDNFVKLQATFQFDWIWGEFGDLNLRDRVTGFSKRLEHVAIHLNSLPRHSENLPTVGSSTLRTHKAS